MTEEKKEFVEEVKKEETPKFVEKKPIQSVEKEVEPKVEKKEEFKVKTEEKPVKKVFVQKRRGQILVVSEFAGTVAVMFDDGKFEMVKGFQDRKVGDFIEV